MPSSPPLLLTTDDRLARIEACLSLSEPQLTVSSGLRHGLIFKRANPMEKDEASCNSRLWGAGGACESLV
jgi:hypothetical protein